MVHKKKEFSKKETVNMKSDMKWFVSFIDHDIELFLLVDRSMNFGSFCISMLSCKTNYSYTKFQNDS